MGVFRGRPAWGPWMLFAAVLLLQLGVFPAGVAFGESPDGVLAVAVAFGLWCARAPGAAWMAALGGLVVDLSGGLLVGLGAAHRAAAAYAATAVGLHLGVELYWPAIVVGLGAAGADQVLAMAGAAAFGAPVALGSHALAGLAIRALLTTALFAVVYPIMGWLVGVSGVGGRR